MRRTTSLFAVLLMVLAACSAGGSQEYSTTVPSENTPSTTNAAWEPVYTDGVLQPLPDGFPDRSLTLVNADEPSHDDGIYARTMQTALKGIAPVNIEVEDKSYPSFGTWTGIQNILDSRGGDEGYQALVAAFTGTALDMLTDPVEEEFGMTLEDLNPVIATERTPFVMVTRADAPWKDYGELVQAAKDSPGKLRYAASVGSQLDISMERLMSVQGWTAEKIPTSGSSEAATVVGAGEADFTMLTPTVARSHVDAGTARVLLVISADPNPPAPWNDAVTTAGIGLPDEPWGSIRGFAVPKAVPELHRQWLFELFKKGAEQQAYKARVTNLPGSSQILMNRDQLVKAMDNALTFAEPIIRELGLLNEQNK